ncbi:MAG: redox-sensing transcriptional repressor Rex [Bacteroidales bacterium]|nr:redox-sensing transcriptional repressor Rex [Bacteroidales bacterium]MDD3664832.1 redox-sensing transcriptional repressor Rex [Bacteroidales bacterium]
MAISLRSLPDKTVERLSQYRRNLLVCLSKGKQHIFSHEIASIHNITPVQVRRDLMLIGYTGTLRKGYDVKELIELIGTILDSRDGLKVCVVGVGNLGRSLISYFNGRRSKLTIVAGFDTNPEKVDKVYAGVHCYHFDKLTEVIQREGVTIAIITVPAEQSPHVAEHLVIAGVKGILNYTPKSVNVPPQVYLEEYDMITSLEKVSYFVKKNSGLE